MLMAELKASGWLLHQQLRHGEGAEGHHHVDEAIHAVEQDGSRTNHKTSRDACDAGQRRHQNGELQRALLRTVFIYYVSHFQQKLSQPSTAVRMLLRRC